MKYDYLIVGAGLFGSVFAYEASKRRRSCLVIDKRSHVGGNIYTYEQSGIVVHEYGPHIFHTSDRYIWEYINQFAKFNNFVNQPLANYFGEIYNLPFNMNTFCKLWPDVEIPKDAKRKIEEETRPYKDICPQNLEEQALKLVGRTIYEKFIKSYTEKQWERKCTELPPEIIKRLPLRFTFDNNYFNDAYQGIPIGGYTQIIDKMLLSSDLMLNVDYKSFIKEHPDIAEKVIYTGPIDEYFDYQYGKLDFRSVLFYTVEYNEESVQGNAVVNYTGDDKYFTRIIEHKYFDYHHQPTSIISTEYPQEYGEGLEPFYPINDEKNLKLLQKYQKLAEKTDNVIFGGRLGEYKYYDMDKCIASVLRLVRKEFYEN